MANSISRRQFDSLCASLRPQEQMEVRGNLDNSKRLYSKSGDDIYVYSRSRDSWSVVRKPPSRDTTPPPHPPAPKRQHTTLPSGAENQGPLVFQDGRGTQWVVNREILNNDTQMVLEAALESGELKGVFGDDYRGWLIAWRRTRDGLQISVDGTIYHTLATIQ